MSVVSGSNRTKENNTVTLTQQLLFKREHCILVSNLVYIDRETDRRHLDKHVSEYPSISELWQQGII